MTTQTLTEFLLARINFEEAEMRRWQAAMDADEEAARGVPSWVIMAGGLKVPARVLAECEAKRRIIGQHPHELNADDTVRRCSTCKRKGYCGTLRALALPYADYPDYRQEWRP